MNKWSERSLDIVDKWVDEGLFDCNIKKICALF